MPGAGKLTVVRASWMNCANKSAATDATASPGSCRWRDSAAARRAVKRSATVLRGKGKVGVFQEEVSEDDQFAHEDGEGEFFGFAVGQEAQVEGFENWVVA
jgi:hypothetical protein